MNALFDFSINTLDITESMKAGIYVIEMKLRNRSGQDNLSNTKSRFYIGQTGASVGLRCGRYKEHLEQGIHKCKELQRDYKVFGAQNCYFYVLDVSKEMTNLVFRKAKEKEIIEMFVSKKIPIYN